MPGVRKEIQQEETYKKYGDPARKVEIRAIGRHVAFLGVPFSGITVGESLVGGRSVWAVGIPTQEVTLAKIEN